MTPKGELFGGWIHAPAKRSVRGIGFITSVATVAIETAASWFLVDHRLPDVVMVYLLGVVVIAMRFGYAPSLLTAALSVAAFDFFFTVPYFSFAVSDKRYVLTFFMMLFVAYVISHLTDRIRRSASAAVERELRTAKLYAMSRELSTAPSSPAIMEVAYRHLREAFASDISVLLPADDGELRPVKTTEPVLELDHRSLARAAQVFSQGAPAVPSSVSSPPTGDQILALHASTGTLGVLLVRPSRVHPSASDTNGDLLAAFATQIALAIERGQLAGREQRAQLEIQRERLRNALLSSVSHDLRTPLAVIKGAVTALLQRGTELSPSREREYLETISDEASRLNRLVRNLLDMTSLEAGAMRLRKDWQLLEEIVGVALNRLDDQLESRPVKVLIPVEAALIPCDATLLEHVLINLIENAVKYTPRGSPIEIGARVLDSEVEVEIADHGPGVPAGQEEQIFEKFYRAAPGMTGMGLGLAICRGIVSVHGGRIWCENRPQGGASFRFVLPRPESPPPTNVLPEAVRDP